MAATSPSPARAWAPAPRAGERLSAGEVALSTHGAPPSTPSGPGDLTLADAVDLALGNSPATRLTWAQARAAAAAYGSANGRFFPTITADVTGGPARAISANPARLPADRRTLVPSVSLQYLLFDFGGRTGTSRAAREALFAADFAHNANLQAVMLQTQQAYFAHQAATGVLAAAQATVTTARRNLEAADRRHEVGLATIADVLQARTALAQAELTAQGADGALQAARATLALAMGIEANRPFTVRADSTELPIRPLAESVDSLIARAERDRPDLAAARALVRQGEAQVTVARSALRPTLTMGSTAGRNFANVATLEGQTYALTLGLQIPIFSGNARQYDVVTARENAAAAAARAELSRVLAAAQVYTAYHALRTAALRVTTSQALLATATQSEQVARGRYAEGVGNILDVLLAQNALADARAQAVTARWTWFSALAQLARDAGALTPAGPAGFRFSQDSTGGTPR
ncbi:MAG: TolC family protein [Gemmatimonadaceae bacterium]|nr:TolC family protein [Gemmatimonadaceae bacterium]